MIIARINKMSNMDNNTLYIIGNGFDLKHNIPSRYSDFATFVKDNNTKLFQKTEKCLLNLSSDGLWSNFEEALGTPNYAELIKDLRHNHEIDKNYPIGVDKSELNIAFRDWVILLKCYIKHFVKTKIFAFSKNSYFLSFNYSNTLEDVYGVGENKIYHIHGYVDSKDKDTEEAFAGYIFGYGENQAQDIIESIKELEISVEDKQDLKQEVESHKKDYQTNSLIDFISNKSFSDIIVLGHSLSIIDEAYFIKLNKEYPNASWHIGYFDTKEYINKIYRCQQMGIENPKFFIDK